MCLGQRKQGSMPSRIRFHLDSAYQGARSLLPNNAWLSRNIYYWATITGWAQRVFRAFRGLVF